MNENERLELVHAAVAARFPLAQAADALRLAESGTVSGKVVLTSSAPDGVARTPRRAAVC